MLWIQQRSLTIVFWMFLGCLIRFTIDDVHKIVTLLKEFFVALWCVTQRSDGNSEPAFLLHGL